VGITWRWTGRERGGPWVWRGAARWRGISVAVAQPRRTGGALPCDSGGRRGQRDADDMANRWAGTR
jgi:hypothetical protein